MTLERPCVFEPFFQTCLSSTNVCERTIVVKWRICVAAKSFVRAKFGKWCVLKCSYSCNHLVPANSLTMPRIILSSTLNRRHRTVSKIVYFINLHKHSLPFPLGYFLTHISERHKRLSFSWEGWCWMCSPYPRGRACLDQGSHRLRIIFLVNGANIQLK